MGFALLATKKPLRILFEFLTGRLVIIERFFYSYSDGMDVKAIIPFKKDGAKSRLGHFLSECEREELAFNMLKDVLAALSKSKIHDVEIITTGSLDELAKEVSVNATKTTLTVRVRHDDRGLNEALNDVLAKEREPVLILMADVPLTTPKSINELSEHDEEVVIVPGRKGGTNALFLRKPHEFFVSYYGTSYLAHMETAQQRNLSHAVFDSFFISTDIDEVDDLIELVIHGNGFAADYLRRLGVRLTVNKNSKTRAVVDRNEK